MNRRRGILRVISEEPTGRWCTEDTYNQLISTCLLDSSKITLDIPSECRLSDELTEQLKYFFLNDNESTSTTLILDFTSFNPNDRKYGQYCDLLCSSLNQRLAFSAKRLDIHSVPFDILIIVSGFDDFLNTVAYKEILIKTCKENKVGLIIIQIAPEIHLKIISSSERLDPSCTRNIDRFNYPALSDETPPIPVEETIQQSIDVIYGHFEITSTDPFTSGKSKTAHVNTLVSLERCLKKDKVLLCLQDIIEKWAEDDNFVCMTIGIQGFELESFVMGIVNNNFDRYGVKKNFNGRKVAIVCDVLWDVYDLEMLAQTCKNRNATDVFILGFAKYKGTDLKTVKYKNIIDVDGKEYEETRCNFCDYGDEVVKGNYISEFLMKIKSFSKPVFWEVVSSTTDAFKDGHWESKTTHYHYLHRFWCEPLFEKHGYSIAVRLKNEITETGIFCEWIDAVICPDEPSAVMLAKNFCRAILLSTEKIIKIKRNHLNIVTGTSMPAELNEYREEVEGKNIVLIDQAAHHFGTVHALKSICAQLGGSILAFVVFIDRLQLKDSIGESLPNSHFISLYQWPWPPYKAEHCPCANKPR